MITLLSGEHGYRYMTEVRSAVAMGLRPSAHILYLKNPRGKWSIEDHTLAIAYETMQQESCPECGKAIWVCRSTEPNLRFTTKVEVCYVTKAKETSKKKLKPGEFIYVRPEMRDGEKLPDRDRYYKQLAEEAAIHSKAKPTR